MSIGSGPDAVVRMAAESEPDPASANTKASAHAVSSADAPIRVVKVKKLQSNRELARQLASSLFLGGWSRRASAPNARHTWIGFS